MFNLAPPSTKKQHGAKAHTLMNDGQKGKVKFEGAWLDRWEWLGREGESVTFFKMCRPHPAAIAASKYRQRNCTKHK